MKKKTKKTTDELIDELARMTQRGFADIASDTATIKNVMVTKDELKAVEKRLGDKIDHVEFIVGSHDRRIDILEDKVRIISTKIGLSRK